MSIIDFTVLAPPEALRQDVECVRIATHSGHKGLSVKVCPSGLPGLVFQYAVHGPAIKRIDTRSVSVADTPVFFLHGQGAEPSIMRFKPEPYTTIQMVFKPQALYTLFGLDASTLRLGFLTPDQFGGAELEQQLLATGGTAERVTLLNTFLIVRLKQAGQRDELIERSLDHIQAHIASITVRELLQAFHISERQFQKRFVRVVGMPPQLYIRVKRINEALRMMNTGRYERLSDIAYLLNFYDQSHFIREMKTFSWVTPKSITQKVSDFHADVAGASYL